MRLSRRQRYYRKINEAFTGLTATDHEYVPFKMHKETYIADAGLDVKQLYRSSRGGTRGRAVAPGSSPATSVPTTAVTKMAYDGAEVWTDVNRAQCEERCNSAAECVGFSRLLSIADDEQDKCYPRTSIAPCHSARKGALTQRTNALKYNTFIKESNAAAALLQCNPSSSDAPNVLIKSAKYPAKYIGILDNEILLLQRNSDTTAAQYDFIKCCSFRIIKGLEGSGTISIRHVDSNKLLIRRTTSELDVIDKCDTTELKQRASFYLLDSNTTGGDFAPPYPPSTTGGAQSPQILLINCYPVRESVLKYITVNPDNKERLLIAADDNTGSQQTKNRRTSDSEKVTNQHFIIISAAATATAESQNKETKRNKEDFAGEDSDVKNRIEVERIEQLLLGGMPSSGEFASKFEDNYMQNVIDQSKFKHDGSPAQIAELNDKLEVEMNKDTSDIKDTYDKLENKVRLLQIGDYLNEFYYLNATARAPSI
jgi:hypothetical protein